MVWIAIHQHWTCQVSFTVTVLSVILVSELVSHNLATAQPEQCGTVGHNLQSQQTRLTVLRFYLNSQNPAPCSGTVTTWEYCYYSPDVTAGEYHAPFGIYRLDGNRYNLQSEMFVIRISNATIGSSSFTCGTFPVPSVTTIQEGDVVGVCINDLNDGTQAHLNLVGSSTTNDSVQVAPTSNNVCDNQGTEIIVPDSVNTQGIKGLSISPSTILHLYANIVPQSVSTTETPTTATESVASTSVPNTTPEVTEATTELEATNEATNETVAPTTMSQTNTGTTSTTVVTMTETTLASNTEQQTTKPSDTTSGSIATNEALMTASDEMTTTLVTTDQTDTVTVTSGTTDMDTPGVIDINAQSSIGPIIGVIVALLLTLIAIIVAILAILLVVRKRKQGSYSVNIDYRTTNPNAIDNAVYDELEMKAQFEASFYEIPLSNHPEQNHPEASTDLVNTYDYTSFDPYEASYATPSASVYELPRDAKENQRRDIYADLQPYQAPSTLRDTDTIYGMIRGFGIIDIPRLVISSVGHLGSGQFANVEEGTWKKGVNKEVRVALKTMKQGATEEDKIKFLQEAAIMAQFRHPNVIALYGVVSQGDPVILVTELMEKGDLRHYLGSIRPDPGELPPADLPQLLLIFSQQVALGMQYLTGKGFVHRDLAARNILVSENKICKVSDFGMSRDLADETYYVAHGGKIPVKWTAPEALHYKKYSTASDVWSYGCLLYEIWSLGHKPFEGISNPQAMRLLESGKRLSPPPGCPRIIYQLMILCWNPTTSHRPSFRDLVLTLVGNQQLVLSIPQDAIETHQLGGVLGAPLEAGENMYQDLQDTYMHMDQDHSTEELDNDYEEFD